MHRDNEAPRRGQAQGGGANGSVGNVSFCAYHSTNRGATQGPRHGSVQSGVWTKVVWASAHMLRKRPERGWAVDLVDLRDAEQAGAVVLELHEQESGHIFSAPLVLIREKGIVFDFDFGVQVCLPLHLWRVS